MKQTAWYASDAFGLRTADEQGKHAFESFAGQHIDFTDEGCLGGSTTPSRDSPPSCV